MVKVSSGDLESEIILGAASNWNQNDAINFSITADVTAALNQIRNFIRELLLKYHFMVIFILIDTFSPLEKTSGQNYFSSFGLDQMHLISSSLKTVLTLTCFKVYWFVQLNLTHFFHQ